ncbi:UNVERIFIED_CONTAM: hypothetical protein Scaly_1424700 [Sesamum calycinum]|uniref:Retrotransposon gag domain-containing protein n=1 Tax=Sesamum calycinum TaxID=2727403 RepID=A0AAW2PMA5_9LAMI
MSRDALGWFKWLHSNGLLSTWAAFLHDLELRFGLSAYENHRQALFKLKQTGTVAKFQLAFETLSNQVLSFPPDARLDCFLSGLRSNIQRKLAVFQPTSMSQAIGLAKLLDSPSVARHPIYLPPLRSAPAPSLPPCCLPRLLGHRRLPTNVGLYQSTVCHRWRCKLIVPSGCVSTVMTHSHRATVAGRNSCSCCLRMNFSLSRLLRSFRLRFRPRSLPPHLPCPSFFCLLTPLPHLNTSNSPLMLFLAAPLPAHFACVVLSAAFLSPFLSIVAVHTILFSPASLTIFAWRCSPDSFQGHGG